MLKIQRIVTGIGPVYRSSWEDDSLNGTLSLNEMVKCPYKAGSLILNDLVMLSNQLANEQDGEYKLKELDE